MVRVMEQSDEGGRFFNEFNPRISLILVTFLHCLNSFTVGNAGGGGGGGGGCGDGTERFSLMSCGSSVLAKATRTSPKLRGKGEDDRHLTAADSCEDCSTIACITSDFRKGIICNCYPELLSITFSNSLFIRGLQSTYNK